MRNLTIICNCCDFDNYNIIAIIWLKKINEYYEVLQFFPKLIVKNIEN